MRLTATLMTENHGNRTLCVRGFARCGLGGAGDGEGTCTREGLVLQEEQALKVGMNIQEALRCETVCIAKSPRSFSSGSS